MYTIQDVIKRLPSKPAEALSAPIYEPNALHRDKLFLAIRQLETHMTDEAWQLQIGFQQNGWTLCGKTFTIDEVDGRNILKKAPDVGYCVIQDTREWEPGRGLDGKKHPEQAFHHLDNIVNCSRIFRVTILKDAHQANQYHKKWSDKLGIHAWIIYYHPEIVKKLAPYVRPEHLLRTYHSVNPADIPPFNENRFNKCLLSGVIAPGIYPLRLRLHNTRREIGGILEYLPHPDPGYRNIRRHTPNYLKILNRYKVSFVTCSCFGYLLRKIIESTVCGCRVITDLPADDIVPEIDGNLIRIEPNISIDAAAKVIDETIKTYDIEKQKIWAEKAKKFFDYRATTKRLISDLLTLAERYNETL